MADMDVRPIARERENYRHVAELLRQAADQLENGEASIISHHIVSGTNGVREVGIKYSVKGKEIE